MPSSQLERMRSRRSSMLIIYLRHHRTVMMASNFTKIITLVAFNLPANRLLVGGKVAIRLVNLWVGISEFIRTRALSLTKADVAIAGEHTKKIVDYRPTQTLHSGMHLNCPFGSGYFLFAKNHKF